MIDTDMTATVEKKLHATLKCGFQVEALMRPDPNTGQMVVTGYSIVDPSTQQIVKFCESIADYVDFNEWNFFVIKPFTHKGLLEWGIHKFGSDLVNEINLREYANYNVAYLISKNYASRFNKDKPILGTFHYIERVETYCDGEIAILWPPKNTSNACYILDRDGHVLWKGNALDVKIEYPRQVTPSNRVWILTKDGTFVELALDYDLDFKGYTLSDQIDFPLPQELFQTLKSLTDLKR